MTKKKRIGMAMTAERKPEGWHNVWDSIPNPDQVVITLRKGMYRLASINEAQVWHEASPLGEKILVEYWHYLPERPVKEGK